MSLWAIRKRLIESGYTNKHRSYSSYTAIRNILENPLYIGQIHFKDVSVDDAHEPLVSKEDFQIAQMLRQKQRSKLTTTPFQSKYLLTGLIFCGFCGARFCKRHRYYTCYSVAKTMPKMIKDPNCKNDRWEVGALNTAVEKEVRRFLMNPDLVKSVLAKRKQPMPEREIASVEKRIHEIDRQIDKLMGLYKTDEIPAEVLRDNISKLYNEKTSLQNQVKEKPEPDAMPFDLVQHLLSDAAQIWDFADLEQKRRILRSLIKRIVLTGNKFNIEWGFT